MTRRFVSWIEIDHLAAPGEASSSSFSPGSRPPRHYARHANGERSTSARARIASPFAFRPIEITERRTRAGPRRMRAL